MNRLAAADRHRFTLIVIEMGNTSTPAHQAVEMEDAETLARLLGAGADPDEVVGNSTLLTRAIDIEGDSALQSGQPPRVHTTAILLAFGTDPELEDPGGGHAARTGCAIWARCGDPATSSFYSSLASKLVAAQTVIATRTRIFVPKQCVWCCDLGLDLR